MFLVLDILDLIGGEGGDILIFPFLCPPRAIRTYTVHLLLCRVATAGPKMVAAAVALGRSVSAVPDHSVSLGLHLGFTRSKSDVISPEQC